MTARTIFAPGTSGTGTRPRALAWVGKPFSPGWCLYWCLVHVFKVPGLGDYDHDGDADATDYWKAAKKRGKVVETADPKKIPAGVLICWTGGSRGYGHAAYSLGNGEMVSTDLPTRGKVGRVPIDRARTQWKLKLVGYVLVDGNGFTLTREPVKAPSKTTTKYETTTDVNLRKTASIRGKTLRVLKKGERIDGLDIVTAGGRDWLHTINGNYVAAAYVKKV